MHDVSMRFLVRPRDSCRDHPGQIQLSLPHAELNAGVSGENIERRADNTPHTTEKI